MKISYRTHPILKMLELGKIEAEDVCGQNNVKKYYHSLQGLWSLYHQLFNRNIKVFSQPFFDCYLKNFKRIADLNTIESPQHGTVIFGKQAYCYLLTLEEHIVVFEFYEGKLVSFLQVANYLDTDGYGFTVKPYDLCVVGALTYSFLNFIRYCPIETKHLKGKSRLKDISCKYVNDTQSNLQILDSKWFTTLVKSDGFNVRGHFRLQPKKKEGVWTKELIWINEFQKEGYTAPAGKLEVYPDEAISPVQECDATTAPTNHPQPGTENSKP